MAKPKQSGNDKNKGAVISLKMDAMDAEPREVVQPSTDAFQQPCTLVGITAGLSGGTLGYVFGFGTVLSKLGH
jgi:hypothetical protein